MPGVEAATGSLGHGLSIGCGIALSENFKNFMTYVLMSDGNVRGFCGRLHYLHPQKTK